MRIFIFFACVIVPFVASAQRPTDTVYFNANEDVISNKEAAAYYRVITKRAADGSFDFTQYQKDGTWLTSHASNTINQPIYDGLQTWYYTTGKPHEERTFVHGLRKQILVYYPNGNLSLKLTYKGNFSPPLVMYQALPDGKALVENGQGTGLLFSIVNTQNALVDSAAQSYTLTGKYIDGVKEGTWTGKDTRGYTVEEQYEHDKFKNGTTITPSGKKHNYTNVLVIPDFKSKRGKIDTFIIAHLQNPADTLNLWHRYDTDKHISIAYKIAANGDITGAYGYLSNGSTVELKLTRKLPRIEPGTVRGIKTAFFMPASNWLGYPQPRRNYPPFQVDPDLSGHYKGHQ
ncbi:MORN repeat protein [Mucilaginibacter yixingensis]|uniref:MORN repeat protein n=1 Tax=Mucilaginibacter yixingensis TaxID=1295612 RepID=A0A2T5JDR1_9SPHI|nr:hypothetical protein [Mucilaginibacter yixingensis]PTQ99910.1 MORN repeat protein [Mucilaginibacter yixingensis]